MDFSILYRIIWQPRDVFKKFVHKTRLEPFIIVAAIVLFNLVNTYRNDLQQLLNHPPLILVGLLNGLFLSLGAPFLDGIIAYLFARSLAIDKVRVLQLISAFILCELFPYYTLQLVVTISGYPGHVFGLGGLVPVLRETHPLLYGLFAAVSPFFIWLIILWHAALSQLLNISRRQETLLLIIMILFRLVFRQVWTILAIMLINPVH